MPLCLLYLKYFKKWFKHHRLDVEWFGQKWTKAESVVLCHVDRPIPICADDDVVTYVITHDDVVVRTVRRRRAVMQVARRGLAASPVEGEPSK